MMPPITNETWACPDCDYAEQHVYVAFTPVLRCPDCDTVLEVAS